MSDIYARKRGKYWEYRFEVATVNGKRKQSSKSGFRTKAEALQEGAKAYTEYMNSGVSFTPSEMSFADYCEYWLENYVKVNCANTTYSNYKKKIRLYILPALGAFHLKNLSPASIQSFINDLFNKGFSRNTLIVIKSILSGCLDYAVEPCQFIKQSPMPYVKLPNKRAKAEQPTRKKVKQITTPEQWEKIMKRFPEGHSSHLPLVLAYRCGFRLSEVFALMWDDIDLENHTIAVQRQVQMNENTKKWTFQPPKYDSYRTVSLDIQTVELLKREYKRQQDCKELYGAAYESYYIADSHPDSEGYLFNNGEITTDNGLPIQFLLVRENGSWINPRTTQHIGRVIHGKANCKQKEKTKGFVEPAISEEWDFHSLRHTHSTMLLEAGIPLPLIQERLGHTDVEMTEHYTNHVTESMRTTLSETLNMKYGY